MTTLTTTPRAFELTSQFRSFAANATLPLTLASFQLAFDLDVSGGKASLLYQLEKDASFGFLPNKPIIIVDLKGRLTLDKLNQTLQAQTQPKSNQTLYSVGFADLSNASWVGYYPPLQTLVLAKAQDTRLNPNCGLSEVRLAISF